MRVVLDTNVWIDWLVFDDPSVAPLKAACCHGHVQIMIDEACLAELDAVLDYPEFKLDAGRRKDCLAQVLDCSTRHDGPPAAWIAPLPRCTDTDDQKFLVLARASKVEWLLTRDKALLRLDHRLVRTGLRVTSPAQWTAAVSQRTAGQASTQTVDSVSGARAVR